MIQLWRHSCKTTGVLSPTAGTQRLRSSSQELREIFLGTFGELRLSGWSKPKLTPAKEAQLPKGLPRERHELPCRGQSKAVQTTLRGQAYKTYIYTVYMLHMFTSLYSIHMSLKNLTQNIRRLAQCWAMLLFYILNVQRSSERWAKLGNASGLSIPTYVSLPRQRQQCLVQLPLQDLAQGRKPSPHNMYMCLRGVCQYVNKFKTIKYTTHINT